ncbi:hypothetical protein MN116_007466, partial [Schistosoma mekongi]
MMSTHDNTKFNETHSMINCSINSNSNNNKSYENNQINEKYKKDTFNLIMMNGIGDTVVSSSSSSAAASTSSSSSSPTSSVETTICRQMNTTLLNRINGNQFMTSIDSFNSENSVEPFNYMNKNQSWFTKTLDNEYNNTTDINSPVTTTTTTMNNNNSNNIQQIVDDSNMDGIDSGITVHTNTSNIDHSMNNSFLYQSTNYFLNNLTAYSLHRSSNEHNEERHTNVISTVTSTNTVNPQNVIDENSNQDITINRGIQEHISTKENYPGTIPNLNKFSSSLSFNDQIKHNFTKSHLHYSYQTDKLGAIKKDDTDHDDGCTGDDDDDDVDDGNNNGDWEAKNIKLEDHHHHQRQNQSQRHSIQQINYHNIDANGTTLQKQNIRNYNHECDSTLSLASTTTSNTNTTVTTVNTTSSILLSMREREFHHMGDNNDDLDDDGVIHEENNAIDAVQVNDSRQDITDDNVDEDEDGQEEDEEGEGEEDEEDDDIDNDDEDMEDPDDTINNQQMMIANNKNVKNSQRHIHSHQQQHHSMHATKSALSNLNVHHNLIETDCLNLLKYTSNRNQMYSLQNELNQSYNDDGVDDQNTNNRLLMSPTHQQTPIHHHHHQQQLQHQNRYNPLMMCPSNKTIENIIIDSRHTPHSKLIESPGINYGIRGK